jgi:hypothetical protein
LSTSGATGGYSMPGISKIRNNILSKITTRDSIITERDYEIQFMYNNIEPFVDAKFLDSTSFVFLFNAIHENDSVINTNAFNIKESDLFNNPFLPKITYNGIDLISPFYYKNKDENQVDAYLVDPEVTFMLSYDKTVLKTEDMDKHHIVLKLIYDFNIGKSYLVLAEGQRKDFSYQFTATTPNGNIVIDLQESNNYQAEISEIYTDEYCIINEYWSNVKLTISPLSYSVNEIDQQSILVLTSDDIYTQLKHKQVFYKYYKEIPENNVNLITDSTAYLDNRFNDIMSTVNDIFEKQVENNIEAYILRMPYLDEAFFFSARSNDFFVVMDGFF